MKAQLTTGSIDQAVMEAEQYLGQKNTDKKDLIRIMLNMEETLLFFQRKFGEEACFSLDKGTSFGRRKIRLTIPGERTEPGASSDFGSDEDRFMQMALARMGQLPKWSYERGANVIVFEPQKRKLPEWQKLLIAILSAALGGTLIRLLPGTAQALVVEEIIAPLLTCFLGFLNAVAGPMIFLSVVWGIYSIGDTATFSVMGKRLGVRFILYLCFVTVLTALGCLLFIDLDTGSHLGGGGFAALYQMILDIIPDNLFTPFSRGNTLQILFEAIVIGISMLVIAKETRVVADVSEQLGAIVNLIMGVISKLVPFFVFGSLFRIIAASDFESLVGGGVFFCTTGAGCVFIMLIHTAAVCIRLKMTPLELWKRTLSTFAIAITTASSAAAFSDNINTCMNKLGVGMKLAKFGVPFGQILYKPAVSILFWFAALSVAVQDHIQITVVWMVVAIVMCIVLSAAAPPVPGGMCASFSILFIQLGLPTDRLGVILSLSAILDFIITASNIFSGQCILAIVANEIGEDQ